MAQCPSFLTLTTQQEIDDFALNYPDCDGTGLSLDINNEITQITNLNGLSQLTTLSNLGIYFTNATDLSGLDNLTTVLFNLRILGNRDLLNLNGLQSLESVGNEFRIVLNDELLSLDGLNGLTEIIGNLDISVNPELQSLSGLNNLTRVRGSVEIKSHPNLTDLLGLESLTEVGLSPADRLYIFNNPLVESLAGLENLGTVNGTFELRSNDNLASITELSLLETVTEAINFQRNNQLSFCAIDVICNNLENSSVEFIFEDNSEGCSSIQEVEESCRQLSISDVSLSEEIVFLPNPVSEILTITVNEAIEIQQIKIFTITGEEVFTISEISAGSARDMTTIDLSGLTTGVYLLQAMTTKGTLTRKIVKE